MNAGTDNPLNEPTSTGSAEDAAFEELLRAAMQARPEPVAPPDLALRAMALAVADESARGAQVARQLARQRWWAQFAGYAAALLIVGLLVGAARLMWSRGDIASIASSTSADESSGDATSGDVTSSDASDTNASAATSTSSTTGTIAVVFVAELLVLGIVLTSMSRRAPTMPWGAEALAGFW